MEGAPGARKGHIMRLGLKTVGYTKADLKAVSRNPELSEADLAHLRPAAEVLPPALLAALARPRGGRPVKVDKKIALTLRLDPDIVAAFKREGPGWQTRINAILRKAVR